MAGRSRPAARRPLGYQFICHGEREGYVPCLAEDHAALVLVDGDAAGWEFWVTTPKASSATRRIPVVVVTSDAGARTAARIAGADAALDAGALLGELPALVQTLARVRPGDPGEALAEACKEPLPEKARRHRPFNAGAYYEQHDLLEELWMEHDGPARELYRAILQVGVASSGDAETGAVRSKSAAKPPVAAPSAGCASGCRPSAGGCRSPADALDALPDDARRRAQRLPLGGVHLRLMQPLAVQPGERQHIEQIV